MIRRPPRSTRTDTLFPYTTLFRSHVTGLCSGPPQTQKLRAPAGGDSHDFANDPGARARRRQGRRRARSCPQPRERSEEHTSELQSLMRISYAVFCLKKKKYTNKPRTTQHTTWIKQKLRRIKP